ncbi:MAG: ribosome-associated translation inhibitor RaiA [Firmicutes bacterium]|nr:ribosome-associated translation inhibitor RaiA [Bacillota bacterium]
MKILVRGDHHLDVTPALREYAEKKIGKLSRLGEIAADKEAVVTLSVTRGVHRVEVAVPLDHVLVRAEERSSDMYASIDLVVGKLEKQLDKYKHRMSCDHRHKLEGGKAKAGQTARARAGGVQEDDEQDASARVVRVKQLSVKPMDLEEAIMQMDLLGHDFFVFANADTEETSVLYRRRDGNYGLIETM